MLERAAATLDYRQPVALMLLLILHLIPDDADPYAIVSSLLGALPRGSYLVVSHPAGDIQPDASAEAVRRYNELVSVPQTRRTHTEVCRFFDGLELLEPGVVQLHQWRPAGELVPPKGVSSHGGVGRKS
ncbi:MAG: SAM-dependent methyltransferase [Streptosporangiaceae bacterium]